MPGDGGTILKNMLSRGEEGLPSVELARVQVWPVSREVCVNNLYG